MSPAINDWKTVTIGDLGQVITGGTPSSRYPELFGTDCPFITPTDIDNSCRYIETERFLSEQGRDDQSSRVLPPGAVCVVCIGATIGKICMTNKHSFTNQQINSIIVNKTNYDNSFVFYLLRTKKEVIKSIAGGAATPIVNKTAFSNIKVVVPPLPTQRKIAAILSDYDDLIENNLRRIKILEEMAQNLYTEWFVRFRFPGHGKVKMVDSPLGMIPDGWEVKDVGQVSINYDRLRRPLSGMERSGRKGIYPYYGAAKIIDYIDDYIFNGEYLLVAEDGSVITVDNRPVLQLVNGKFWPNNHTHIIQGKPPISTKYLNLFLSNYDISGHITGAAQPKITQENLGRIKIITPDINILRTFDSVIDNIFSEVMILDNKNKKLRQTRDLLLPRLISGELYVSDLDIKTGNDE